MNMSRRTQKQKPTSQIIHPIFRRDDIFHLNNPSGHKHRFLLTGVIAVLCTVAPPVFMPQNTSNPLGLLSYRLTFRTRKIIRRPSSKHQRTTVDGLVEEDLSLVHTRNQPQREWYILNAFIDFSQTIRGSPTRFKPSFR